MFYVSEETVAALVSQGLVTTAVEAMYKSMAREEAVNFPVVRETLHYAEANFGFKSGFDRAGPTLGVKAGGLWPGNKLKGLLNHQSTVMLFDPESGAPLALVRGTLLTVFRTAAATALSIRYLAIENASVLGIVGAGGQAEQQVRAALSERPFKELLICARSEKQSQELAARLTDAEVSIRVCEPKELAGRSDVIITVTPSRHAILSAEWILPGTHIACVGADTFGKQELDPAVVEAADLYCDEPSQSISIGEFQHAYGTGAISGSSITPIGLVIQGTHPGRIGDDRITIFDSTGVGLQDVVAARLALDLALKDGRAVELA